MDKRLPIDSDPSLLANRNDEQNTRNVPEQLNPPAAYNSNTAAEDRHLALNKAAVHGDWETARRIIEGDRSMLKQIIGSRGRNALHIAASAGQSEFVEKLMDWMDPADLTIGDSCGWTGLHIAAWGGCVRAAKALVKKNPYLPQIVDLQSWTPLLCAVWTGARNSELTWYLCSVTTDAPPARPFTGPTAAKLFYTTVAASYYDVAIYLLEKYPKLATTEGDWQKTILHTLALRPSAFLSGKKLGFWENCIYQLVPVKLKYELPQTTIGHMEADSRNLELSYLTKVLKCFDGQIWRVIRQALGINKVHEDKLRFMAASELVGRVLRLSFTQLSSSQLMMIFGPVISAATRNGIEEIVTGCLQFLPDLIFYNIEHNQKSLFQEAIEYRNEKIINLLLQTTERHALMANWPYEYGSNTLHLTAKLPLPSKLNLVSGSALQMQRELQWFKAVEKCVNRGFQENTNNDLKTPWELFVDEHKQLAADGEKWMKDTSNSCMVVATLIATVLFAAAFTIPGGNLDNTGIPIYLNSKAFILFATSDALGLFSSSTSLLMFLSILTARYAPEDFLVSLPKRLILGLASLFFAVATMMIAFSATLWIVLDDALKWVSLPITLVASFPVTLFILLQLPLFIEMVQTTFGSGIFRIKHIKSE